MSRKHVAVAAVFALAVVLSACSGPNLEPESETEVAGTAEAGVTVTAPNMPTSEATEAPSATATSVPVSTATLGPTATLAPSATPRPTATPEPIPVFESTSTPTPAPPTPTSPVPTEVWTITRFETDEPLMVLTFDAGSDRGFAAEILDTLADKGVKATFGMTGAWAEANPDLIQRIVAEGHDLINHSWSHPDFTTLTSAERSEELESVNALVEQQVGISLKPYFRPPFGAYDQSVLDDLLVNGYSVNVMWSVDTLGWNGLSADEINQRVFDGAQPGAIILMHVGAASQDAAALSAMIDTLRGMGYSFATVHELAGR